MSANPSRIGLKIFVVLLVLAAAAVSVVFTIRPVARVEAVRPGKAAEIVSGTVVVSAEKMSLIMSEAEGRLSETRLEPNLEVKEGDVLAQIDPADLTIKIEHAKREREILLQHIEIDRAKRENDWKNIVDDMKISRWNHEKGALPDAHWAKAERAYASAEQAKKQAEVAATQSLENKEYEIQTLGRQLEKMTIKAPFDGIIAETLVNKGDLINNKQALAKLITKTRIVTGKISEEKFALVQLGKKATVKFLGYGEELFAAVVSKLLPAPEEATQRYLVYLDVAIALERLKPGLTGEVGITVAERDAQALVQRRAVLDGKFVYVVENGRVVKRPVELGFTSLTVAEVLKGLAPGEWVIVDELDKFAHGDRVRVEQRP